MNTHITTDYARSILLGLNNKTATYPGHPTPTHGISVHMFGGVDVDEIRAGRRLTQSKLERRRAAAKVARRSRKVNRR